MAIEASILCSSSKKPWVEELQSTLSKVFSSRVEVLDSGHPKGKLLFIDSGIENLFEFLKKIDRKQKALFLVVQEDERQVVELLEKGWVDDVLVWPFRELEIHSKMNRYHQILMWDEVSTLSDSFSDLVERLKEDLQLTERLHKRKIKTSYKGVKGLEVSSRYLAGLRPGGDYFDLAESKARASQVSLVMTDSSSYGLSSAVLTVLMRIMIKLASENCIKTVNRIYEEISDLLGEKDKLSLFYGTISRRDLKLRYLNLGNLSIYHAKKDKNFKELRSHGEWITRRSQFKLMSEGAITLHPNDRLILLSDGFTDELGGAPSTLEVFNHMRSKEQADILNELVYRVKSGFSEETEFPLQDCTAVVIDVNANALRVLDHSA